MERVGGLCDIMLWPEASQGAVWCLEIDGGGGCALVVRGFRVEMDGCTG